MVAKTRQGVVQQLHEDDDDTPSGSGSFSHERRQGDHDHQRCRELGDQRRHRTTTSNTTAGAMAVRPTMAARSTIQDSYNTTTKTSTVSAGTNGSAANNGGTVNNKGSYNTTHATRRQPTTIRLPSTGSVGTAPGYLRRASTPQQLGHTTTDSSAQLPRRAVCYQHHRSTNNSNNTTTAYYPGVAEKLGGWKRVAEPVDSLHRDQHDHHRGWFGGDQCGAVRQTKRRKLRGRRVLLARST